MNKQNDMILKSIVLPKKKLLEEEIRIFKKNEKALYDFLNLVELSSKNINVNNSQLICLSAIENIINDFEDEEVTLDLNSSASLIELIHTQTEEFYKINKKYEKFEECKELLDKFRITHKNGPAIIFLNKMNSEKVISSEDSKFSNLFFKTLEDVASYQGIQSFLCSDISIENKLISLDKIADNFGYYYVYEILASSKYNSLGILPYNKLDENRKELLKILNSSVRKTENKRIKREFLSSLLSYIEKECNNNPYLLGLFNEFIDFNDIKYNIPYKNDNLIISVAVDAYYVTQNIEVLKELYNDESYSILPARIRHDNDRLLINSLLNNEDLIKFIKFKNLKIDDYTITYLSERFIDKYKGNHHSSKDNELLKKSIQIDIDKVKCAIISKANSDEEERKYKNYVNRLQKQIELGYKIIDEEEIKEYDDQYEDYGITSKINRTKKLINTYPHKMCN